MVDASNKKGRALGLLLAPPLPRPPGKEGGLGLLGEWNALGAREVGYLVALFAARGPSS